MASSKLRFGFYTQLSLECRKISSMRLSIVKRILAILIAVCFFLPLSQCASKSDPEVSLQERVEASQARVETTNFVAYETIEFKSIDEVTITLMFVWPLISIFISSIAKRKMVRIAIYALELLASAGSIFYLIQIFSVFTKILPAGYLLLATFFLYFAVAVVSVYRETQSLIKTNAR
jgi:hypothetical protein